MTEVKPLSDEERLFTGVHGPHPQAVNDIRRAFTALKAENEKLRVALEWYEHRAARCCKITSDGDDARWELDHVQPKARGGSDSISNLRWVCAEVNIIKRDLTDQEFVALCSQVMRWIGERIQAVESITQEKAA